MATQSNTHSKQEPDNKQPSSTFQMPGFKGQAIILAIICLIFYWNTFSNDAAFDDRMAITDNEYVQKGLAGIGDILTKDAYQSYLAQHNRGNQLAGGRYRPLSLITFAIEQQLLGLAPGNETPDAREVRVAHDMHFRHVVNVVLYIISVIALLYLFTNVLLRGNSVAAFTAALLFAVHPVHTEVVANVKSRDEILSLLFITLTFIQFFRYTDGHKKGNLLWALLCFFLALLSKEYAVTLLVLIPLSVFIFRKQPAISSVKSILPFLAPLGIYLLLRFSAVSAAAEGAEKDVLNNPYLYASATEMIATKIFVLLDYLRLLIFPHPLSADYSYAAIPYRELSNPVVWLSAAIYLTMACLMIWLTAKRHFLGFAIAFFLFNLLLVSNFLFDIGAPMGERLIYHSSVGFCLVVSWLLCLVTAKFGSPKAPMAALIAVMVVIIVFSAFKSIERNNDWKNDATLFLRDVKTVPNSALANNNAAASCMLYAKASADFTERKQWLEKAIVYFDKAISVYPGYMLARLNRGLCYFNVGEPDKALPDWDTVKAYQPGQPNLPKYLSIAAKYFYSRGMKYAEEHKVDSAIVAFQKSAQVMPEVPDAWYQLGVQYALQADYTSAKAALSTALKLAPNFPQASKLYDEISTHTANP